MVNRRMFDRFEPLPGADQVSKLIMSNVTARNQIKKLFIFETESQARGSSDPLPVSP